MNHCRTCAYRHNPSTEAGIACATCCDGNEYKPNDLMPDLLDALMVVCHALAAWRDGEDVSLEELKYMVVDRALELAKPGFDGGTTSVQELRKNIVAWQAILARYEGGEA